MIQKLSNQQMTRGSDLVAIISGVKANRDELDFSSAQSSLQNGAPNPLYTDTSKFRILQTLLLYKSHLTTPSNQKPSAPSISNVIRLEILRCTLLKPRILTSPITLTHLLPSPYSKDG